MGPICVRRFRGFGPGRPKANFLQGALATPRAPHTPDGGRLSPVSASQVRAGGCLCGAITFHADCANVLMAAHCHCLDCRKATGSAFATVVAIPSGDLTVDSGETKTWTVTGMSGQVTREFCGTCGSPMFSASTGSPELIFIKAGAFDDADWIEPAIACWTTRQLPWAQLPTDIASVPTNP
jgi:hypothetical protein